MALELYAKQARNTDAERKASEVRLRAERTRSPGGGWPSRAHRLTP